MTTSTDIIVNHVEEVEEWQDLLGTGSLMKKIVKAGETATRPKRGQKVNIHYTLSLKDGTVIETVNDFELQLGDCEVVQGLDVGLGLMNIGEQCTFKIVSRLAFGDIGLPPLITGNANVIYHVELLSACDGPVPEELSIPQRKTIGNRKRERGNWWYGRGECSLAIQCYRRALDYLDDIEVGGGDSNTMTSSSSSTVVTDDRDAAILDLLEDRISVWNNMAAAQLKLQSYDAALLSLQRVLQCQPDNVKALYRKAKVHREKNDMVTALAALKKANSLAPDNYDVLKEISQISRIIQQQKMVEKELAKRMLGRRHSQDASNNNKCGKKVANQPKKTNVIVWSALLAVSFAVGLVGIAAYKLKFP